MGECRAGAQCLLCRLCKRAGKNLWLEFAAFSAGCRTDAFRIDSVIVNWDSS